MPDNSRQETRLPQAQTIFIEVRSSYPGDSGGCRLLVCNSVDVSANGIRARIDDGLPIGAIYPLCVEIHEPAERLFLVAEVKWIRPAEDDDGYYVGLAVFESDDTDIERWKRHIADQLSRQ